MNRRLCVNAICREAACGGPSPVHPLDSTSFMLPDLNPCKSRVT